MPLGACGHVRTCTDGVGHEATSEWACHMPAEWAALGSRHDEMPMHDGCGCPGGEYWGHKCVAWRWRVRDKMVEHGMDAALCGFVLEDGLGFEPDFGKLVHAWNAKRDKVRWMLSIVDKFVTLLCGSERPA